MQGHARLTEIHGNLAPFVEQRDGTFADLQPQLLRLRRGHVGVLLGALAKAIDGKFKLGTLLEDFSRSPRRRHRSVAQTRQGDERPRQAAVQSAWREGRDTGRLHAAVERLMISGEALIVRSVPRLVDIEKGDHEARALVIAADAARSLDVLRGSLRLAVHDHKPQARNVQAD